MSAIAEVVANVLAADLPVLFVDTCNLIDVIRAPLRGAKLDRCVEAAQELIRLANDPPIQCVMIVGSLVPGERTVNAGVEADNLHRSMTQADEDVARFHAFCRLVGLAPPFPLTDFTHSPLAEKLLALSRQLLDSAFQINQDENCNRRALERACNYVPPSRRGGEIKD